MADTLTPAGVLNQVIESRVERVKLTGFRTLANMADRNMIRVYNDTDLNFDADVGGEAASWLGITAPATNNNQGNTVKGQLTYGTHRLSHQFTINKVDFNVAAQRAPGELSNLFGSHTDRALLALMRKLNTAIFKADGTATYGNMIGLEKMADNSYDLYGISGATYPLWKVIKNTSAVADVTIGTVTAGNTYSLTIDGVANNYVAQAGDDGNAVLNGLSAAIYENFSSARVSLEVPDSGSIGTLNLLSNPEWAVSGGTGVTVGAVKRPRRGFSRSGMLRLDQLDMELEATYDMVVTTPSVGTSYSEEFDKIAGNLAVPRGGNDNQLRTSDLGHGSRSYNGYPIVEDPQASAGRIWLIDSIDLEMLFMTLPDMTSYGYASTSVNTSFGIPIHIFEVPPTIPTARTFEMHLVPQMRLRNRRSLKVMEDLK